MRVVLSVKLYQLENKINRQIAVDDNISLQDLCEFIIVSMNGNKIPFYMFEYEDVKYYPDDSCDEENEKSLLDLKLKDLEFKKGSEFYIDYNFEAFYEIDIIVEDIIESDKNNYFEVLKGNGYGVLDGEKAFYLKSILDSRKKDNYYSVEVKNYLQKKFDVLENNNKIKEYIEYRKELVVPKRYVFNVSLEEFNTEIKRKIVVDSDILIDSFCRKVIVSMNGDLSHGYGIKRNKEYLDENYEEIELFYLDLKEKQRLKIIYDWGDHWVFNLTLSKIIEGFGDNVSEVLSGKGYGIIEDCGGSWELNNIFNGNNTELKGYDINEFDLEKCNEIVQKTF